jgi:hypothetical protein
MNHADQTRQFAYSHETDSCQILAIMIDKTLQAYILIKKFIRHKMMEQKESNENRQEKKKKFE